MAEAAGMVTMPDETSSHGRARLLTQIAAALDLPVEALTDRPSSHMPSAASDKECAQLLEAFCRIEDQSIRTQCLAFVEGFTRRKSPAR